MGLRNDPAIRTTYTWNLGNGTTATGPGPITTVYTGAGPYTVTLTVNSPFGVCSSSFSVTPTQGGGCCPSGIAAGNLLGSVGTTTVLPPGTYSGTYRVLGDLLLTNGSYALTPGTIFYVDGQASKSPQRQVTGASITLGANASLVLDGATLTASGSGSGCPMWRGLVLDHQGQGPSGTYRLIVQNNSTISHALCGLTVADVSNVSPGSYTGTSNYLLDHATFANNLTHVSDETDHPGTQPSLITNCTFRSDPTQMHLPYDENPATGDKYYTYEALRLLPRGIAQTPLGNLPANAIEVRNNTIDQAVYGIVNNQFDKAAVLIAGNYLNKIFQTGIWTVNSYSNQGTSLPVVSNNRIGINAYPPQNTDQIDPAATVFGIVGEDPYQPNAFVGNQIAGDKNSGAKPQVGMSIQQQASASGNVLENLNEGIQTSKLDGSDIFDNRLIDCDDGFVVLPSSGYLYYLNRLGCNTFSQSGPAPASRGIVVPPDATINDIGDFSNPAANKFEGLGNGDIYNDGSPFTYYRTSSTQEPASRTGSSNVTLQTVFLPRRSLVNYCLNQGAGNGNGVNNFRVAVPSASYIAALMDSVRRQLVPAAQYRDYLYEVLDYHARAQQLPALETWWLTLAVPNAAAYRTVGRYLLRAYDAKPTTAGAAQRVLAALQPAALLNAELAAQLQLRAVLRHLPQTTPRLAAADSVVLRTLAWSGTSVAAPAGRWLRYYHPRIALPAAVPALRPAAARRKTVLAESGASLGAAYPNPAQTEVNITCQLAQADQVAELRFTNLLTGKTVLAVPVAGTGTERRQRVALAGLPAGQYAYQLVVEGQLVAAPQKLMVNP